MIQRTRINILILLLLISFTGILSQIFSTIIIKGKQDTVAKQADVESSTEKTKPTQKKSSQTVRASARERSKNYALLPNTQRGTIEDRNGIPLAYSEYRYNLYLDGRAQEPLNESSIKKIADLIGFSAQKVRTNLYNGHVTLLKRFAEKDKARILYELRSPHFLTERVLHRHYPEGTLSGQTVGFIGHDEHGLAGLELSQNERLSTFTGLHTGNKVHIRLSLDKTLQRNILQKLKKTVMAKDAQSGVVIVQDVATRQIRALTLFPTFDPNAFTQYKQKSFKNHATSTIIEPGSIFKVLFSAYLLEQQEDYDIDEKSYFCKGYYELSNGEIINCTGEHGEVSLADIIRLSCNAGMIQATEHLSIETMRAFLSKLGFGTTTGIEIPGEERGILPTATNWGLRTKATSVIGQGIGATPLQIINAFTTVVSDGIARKPSLIQSFDYYEDNRLIESQPQVQKMKRLVIRQQTAAKVRKLIANGVQPNSTGAAVLKAGYKKILGKTSTSQIADLLNGGYYLDRYNSLFAGAYPKDDPRFTVLVVIIAPKKDYHGGRTAAPLFAEILDDIIRNYSLNDERTKQTFAFIPELSSALGNPSPTPQSFPNTLETRPFSLIATQTNNLYNNMLFAATPQHNSIPNISTRQVPDFSSLSLRRTLILLSKLILENTQREYRIRYQLIGNGYVVKQEPPAGTPIQGDFNLKLFLSR